MAPAVKDKKSGRFTKKSIAEWKKNVSVKQKEVWADVRAGRRSRKCLKVSSGNITSTMRRVTELQQLAKDLWCFECEVALSLRDYIPDSERKFGLASTLDIKCQKCKNTYKIQTGKRQWNELTKHYVYDMNCKLSVGCIDSSLGSNEMNSLLTTMNIPATSKSLMKRHERLVGPSIESVAKKSCADNIELEKKLTEESNSSHGDSLVSMTSDDIAVELNAELNGQSPPQKKMSLTGSFDTGWQKRGTGRSYNSKSGHAALIGYYSGGILAYGVKSTACAMCDKGHPKSDHDCRKNHCGSAKSMEPQLAVELVARNPQLENANVVIGTLVGDDDSCSIQAIRRESTVPVTKWLDLNHVRKGFASSMYSLHVPDNIRSYMCKSFGYAVAQNKGDAAAVKNAILNVEKHAYGEHDGCGPWCKYTEDPVNYKHKGLPGGKPLTCKELRAQLTAVLARYAENADKIAPCASSQANESFNNLVATKNPKYKFNASSQALPFRVAAAVCQKNIGTSYVVDVNQNVGVSPGDETKKFRSICDKYRSVRSSYQKTRQYKIKRSSWKKKRASKDSAVERSEGVTYSTGCELNGIADLVDDPAVMNVTEIAKDSCAVYFDLETTGLSKLTCEVTQIAAKILNKQYSAYIVPKKCISPAVTALTGLKSSGGELFLNGNRVVTTPHRLAMSGLVNFLKGVAPCMLVAHNGMRFDAPIILRDLRKVGLLEEFMQVCGGFVDTLHVFHDKLPGRKSYKQTTLAADYDVPNPSAHNALADVTVLETLVQKMGVTNCELLRHVKNVACVIQQEDNLATRKINALSLKSLQPTVSACMISKIAAAGITMEKLKLSFQNGGVDAVTFLLAQDVNGKPKVTKMKKKIEEIVTAIKTVLDINTV